MCGFTSTTLNFEDAISHALKNTEKAVVPVVVHVQWRDRGGYSAFWLNTSAYSAMPHEEEVLIQDGALLKILDVIENYEVLDK